LTLHCTIKTCTPCFASSSSQPQLPHHHTANDLALHQPTSSQLSSTRPWRPSSSPPSSSPLAPRSWPSLRRCSLATRTCSRTSASPTTSPSA
uniref:Uncharacterized protein n=1 Tax=Aegilops tauschii subsp. strangulata TaxID=200361 RepID=A0A453GNJ4_AEGTS